MNGKHETLVKLLPRNAATEADRDEPPVTAVSRLTMAKNLLICLATALVLAYLLLPRVPVLKKGETAPRDITAPYSFYFEYPGPDQTTLSSRVEKGELIAESGHRVTERAAKAIEEIARREGAGGTLNAFFGLGLLLVLLFYLFYRDIKRYRPALTGDTKKFVLLAVLLVMTIVLSRSFLYVLTLLADTLQMDPGTVSFALPAAAGAMLVSLLLDFHLTLGFSFVVCILLGVLFRGDPLPPLFYFIGSIVAGLAVIRFKKRSAIIRAGVMVALTNMAAAACIDLYRGELLSRGWFDLGAGAFGALVATMIVSVSVPFFETIFDIATDIKLLELLDPNQPLLKKLVYSSPGTYHHSIVIGNLAEAAAEAIGENPLLARVGAYYHDIGKIRKPEYFIENQRHQENKHDKLSPSMSSLIIAAHVKDGVELAREHRLPSIVSDIIRQHHGTSLITYFYQKAKVLQPLENIDEEAYRYQGPRPRTKLAAVVMLADSVEASSRTLEDPTPERIQILANSVITRIFLDDQLSKSDLTLKDLREIARSFTTVLNGIFHQRIDYPGSAIPGEKRRSDNPDKKHPVEIRAADGQNPRTARDTATDPRPA